MSGVHETYFASYSLALAAGAETVVPGRGSLIYIAEATDAVQLGLDEKSYFNAALGFSFATFPGEFFNQVRVKNNTAAALTLTLWIGNGTVIDRRLNVAQGRNASVIKGVPNSITGAVVNTIPNSSNAPIKISGSATALYRYLYCLNAPFDVFMSASPVGFIRFPALTPIRLDYSGDFYVRSSSVGTDQLTVMDFALVA